VEKGFGILKKPLNVAIAAGRIDEPYEMHAHTISNPIHIRKKRQKSKDLNQINTTNKSKKRVISENFDQSKQDNSDRKNQEKILKFINELLKD
jgi:hypothetical protein